MITMLKIGGVDITPYIAHKGYSCQIEDLDASAERSMSGALTRDRVARVPTVEVEISPMLKQADVQTILTACKPAKISCQYYNSERGGLETAFFYAKVKSPKVYSTAGDVIRYEGFSISLKGFAGVAYA